MAHRKGRGLILMSKLVLPGYLTYKTLVARIQLDQVEALIDEGSKSTTLWQWGSREEADSIRKVCSQTERCRI